MRIFVPRIEKKTNSLPSPTPMSGCPEEHRTGRPPALPPLPPWLGASCSGIPFPPKYGGRRVGFALLRDPPMEERHREREARGLEGENCSIFLGRNISKFGKGLLQGGLIAVHEALGAAEALDAVEIVVERIGGRNEVIERYILIILQ